jgi:hypothetical protein
MKSLSTKQLIVIAVFCFALISASSVWFLVERNLRKVETPISTPAATTTSEAPKGAKLQLPSLNVIGVSVQNRKIEAYTFGNGTTHLVFVGGIHGGYEWNSVVLAYQFIDYLNHNPEFIPKNLTVTVIPSMNPDGVFKIIGKEGVFAASDVPTGTHEAGRLNANKDDLNRNFACNWKPTGVWREKPVSAGTAAFSEPESATIKKFVLENKPAALVFWHSQANAVYGSQCGGDMLPETKEIMTAYAKAAGYPAITTFDDYEVSGDITDWLASINIPAFSVELKTHETIEWDKNLSGIKALFKYYEDKK